MADWLFGLFVKLQISVFRRSNGKRMAHMRGMPVLLLTTIGRKSGQTRTTPLMYLRDGEKYVVIASNNGRERHPGWYHNLRSSTQARIEVPGKQLKVTASEVGEPDRARLWLRLVQQAPFFEAYRNGTTRAIPLLWLERSGSVQ